MRPPILLRTTPFRLTLVFMALFAAASGLFLAYIYVATAGEIGRRADSAIGHELLSLDAVYRRGGYPALNEAIIERSAAGKSLLYLLSDPRGAAVSGTIARSPLRPSGDPIRWTGFFVTSMDPDGAMMRHAARGAEQSLPGGWRLFVGVDTGESQTYMVGIARAVWGAGALVLVLGLGGGLLVSRNVTRRLSEIGLVIDSARMGDLSARAHPRDTADEFDALSAGLNDMLERLERSMSGLRHAGDAIAHDLRSPLTRLRARLEAALMELQAGRGEPDTALRQAVEDADSVLRTFSAVLAIARLEAAGEVPDQKLFDLGQAVEGVAELYAPLCEDKQLDFRREIAPRLLVKGNEAFLTQAAANILDNAVKYTPEGGAITARVRRRSSGDVEISVTDTGPGIPAADRPRVVDRFVRLQSSRSEPGAGLGLSLVAAVARAHRGHLELDDGPAGDRGLRAAIVLPRFG